MLHNALPGLDPVWCGHGVMRNGDTLRNWVQRDRVDAGELPGTTSADATRISELERRFVSCGARTRSFAICR